MNILDEVGATALHWASMNDHRSIVKYVHYKTKMHNISCIFSYLMHFEAIDVNVQGGDLQATPLYWAIRQKNVYLIPLLLANGADPNVADVNGVNAFYLAVQCEAISLTAYLVAKECDVNVVTKGATALHWIVRHRYNVSMVRTLLALRINPNAQDDEGNTALHHACMQNKVAFVSTLLKHGVDWNIVNAKGQFPMDVCPESGAGQMLQGAIKFQNRKVLFPYAFLQKQSTFILFSLPWLFLLCTMVVVSSSLTFSVAMFAELVVLGIVCCIASSTGLFLQQSGQQTMAPISFGFALAILTILGIHAVFYLAEAPYTSLVLKLPLWWSIYWTLYRVKTTDAGTLSKPYNAQLKAIVDVLEEPSKDAVTICPTCLVRQCVLATKSENIESLKVIIYSFLDSPTASIPSLCPDGNLCCKVRSLLSLCDERCRTT